MFEEIYGLEDIIQTIALEKIFFDYKEDYTGGVINGERFYETALEAVYDLCSHVEYLEYTDSTIYFFSFSEMRKFYDLCKEHSRKNHIKFQKNPYVKAAKRFVFAALDCSGMQNVACNYWIPPKLKRKREHQFLIEAGCYFREWIEMIDVLYEIRQYFREKCEEIEKELKPVLTLVKPKKMPAAKKKGRKAA